MAIHHTTVNINHQHTTVTTEEANLPRFNRLLHGKASKAIKTLLADLKYEAPARIFEDRQTHQMRLLDAEAAPSTIIYGRLNPVSAGLVRRPEDMPDCPCNFRLWKLGEPFIIKRPPVYFDNKRGDAERQLFIDIDPQTSSSEATSIASCITSKSERAGVQAFARARRFPVLGAKKLRRIHPYKEPRSNRESGGEVIPTFKSGARDRRAAKTHHRQQTTVLTEVKDAFADEAEELLEADRVKFAQPGQSNPEEEPRRVESRALQRSSSSATDADAQRAKSHLAAPIALANHAASTGRDAMVRARLENRVCGSVEWCREARAKAKKGRASCATLRESH